MGRCSLKAMICYVMLCSVMCACTPQSAITCDITKAHKKLLKDCGSFVLQTLIREERASRDLKQCLSRLEYFQEENDSLRDRLY